MYDCLRIRKLIASKSLTQKEFAPLAGISEGTLTRVLLTGNAKPETMRKIAEALGVAVEELIKD